MKKILKRLKGYKEHEKMIAVTLRLEPELFDDFEKTVKNLKCTKAKLLRALLEDFIDKYKRSNK